MGRPPIGKQAMTSTERSRRRRDLMRHNATKSDATVSATESQSVAAMIRAQINVQASAAGDYVGPDDLERFAKGAQLALAMDDDGLLAELAEFVSNLIQRKIPKAKRRRLTREEIEKENEERRLRWADVGVEVVEGPNGERHLRKIG